MTRKGRIICGIILFASIILAIYIMINGLGLVDSLDFGAGAYYYADIPEFEKYVNGDAYTLTIPAGIIFFLFFLWEVLYTKYGVG